MLLALFSFHTMNDTAAQNLFASTQHSDKQSSHPSVKRRKLALQVAIESGADGRQPIHEVFPDGTFAVAPDSHFERTSAAASAFVARALANPFPPAPIATATDEKRATNSDAPVQWASTALSHAEGSIWELGRAIGVIDALFANSALLKLKRIIPRTTASNPSIRDGAALLMEKHSSMQKCADDLSAHLQSLTRWLEADNTFCDSFLMLRKRCHGVRRAVEGTPLIDVGDADFVAVRRPSFTSFTSTADNNDTRVATDDSSSSTCITFPAPLFLKFSLHQVDKDFDMAFSPVVQETATHMEDNSVKAVIRRIRLARASAFRRVTFDVIAKQASTLSHTADLSSSCVTVDSGPSDLLSIEHTHRAENVPSVDIDLSTLSPGQTSRQLQLAAILQTVAIHGTLIHCFSQERVLPSSTPTSSSSVLDRLLNVTSTRKLLTRLESVLDTAVQKLRVRLEWTRGNFRPEETRVRIYSSCDDGDGAKRLLATVEPISHINNAGHVNENGHVRIIPAFGVIIPAPDDPSVHGRAVACHSSSSGNGMASGLDDVPRGYACPVGGEIMSALTLMLCVRLLDSLETIARAEIDEILDVDRQCFTVIVSSPLNGRILKARVWPQGNSVGDEAPGVSVWYNGNRVDGFSGAGDGRLAKWKRLLKQLVVDDISNERDEKFKKERVTGSLLGTPSRPQISAVNGGERAVSDMFSSSDPLSRASPSAQGTHIARSSSLMPNSVGVAASNSLSGPAVNSMLHPNAGTRHLPSRSDLMAQYALEQSHNSDPTAFRFNI